MVLGHRITSHSFTARPNVNSVEIKGRYDVHIWYTYAQGALTAVEKKTVHYTEHLPVVELEGTRLGQNETVEVEVIRDPSVTNVQVRRGAVQVEVEVEFYVEITGETKLWVRVYEPPFADDKKDKKAFDLDLSSDYFDEDDFDEDGEYDDEFEDEDLDFVP